MSTCISTLPPSRKRVWRHPPMRTACADKMGLRRLTSLNRASWGTNPFSCMTEHSLLDPGKQITGVSVCLESFTQSLLLDVTKLPVVLWLPQHLVAVTVLNFSTSATYFLDPDSRLLSPIASEVPCSALFTAIYQTHQGWIAVTPDIHQAPPPKPLPVPPMRRTEDVFQEQNYNEGGLYQPATLDAMQDFLLTPLLWEAVTYKLAHQVHNMRPKNEYALGPLDIFPSDVAATADWRNLLFRGWWSWLEKWGSWPVSLSESTTSTWRAAGRSRRSSHSRSFTMNMGSYPTSCGVWVPGKTFSRCDSIDDGGGFKQHLTQSGEREVARAPPVTAPHEYLALNEVEIPQLPRRNRTRSNVYLVLPHQKPTSVQDEGSPMVVYTAPERRGPAEEALPHHQPLATNLHVGSRPTQLPLVTNQDPVDSTLPGGRCSSGCDFTTLNHPCDDKRSCWFTCPPVWRVVSFPRGHFS